MLIGNHVKKVEISREHYEQMVSQVKECANGKVKTTATDQDQPSPQGRRFPAWVREAEELASQAMPTLEQNRKGAEGEL